MEKSTELTQEKQEIFNAGLQSEIYQQIDDTGMRIAGKNGYATIVCNEHYAAYFINDRKNRETVKRILGLEEVVLFLILLCDDAPQFKTIAKVLALCWIHEERHYGKLRPVFECHRNELERIRAELWEYYKRLKEYKKNPTVEEAEQLSLAFVELFGQKTGYEDLDKRLSLN